jgi:hypothetical protein
MGVTAQAGYLCQTHQAKSYKDACAMLRSPRVEPKKSIPLQNKKYWWDKA